MVFVDSSGPRNNIQSSEQAGRGSQAAKTAAPHTEVLLLGSDCECQLPALSILDGKQKYAFLDSFSK